MMHHVPESGQGEDALADRDPDRRLGPELGKRLDHVLGNGFLVEAHVVRFHPPGQADRLAERVRPVAVSHQKAVIADDAPGPGDQLEIPIRVVAQPHLDAFDPHLEDIVEIRLVPAEIRFERSRPRRVQRQAVHTGAENGRQRDAVLLTEDVPQCDLDGADDLRGDTVPSEVAVQPQVHLGQAGPDGQRVLADQHVRKNIIDDGLHDRGVRVPVGRACLTPSDVPGVRVDLDEREAAMHLRIDLHVAGRDGRDPGYLHTVTARRPGRSVIAGSGPRTCPRGWGREPRRARSPGNR